MRTLLSFCCCFFFSLSLFATHIEAGEITYRQLQGFTYEATLVLYVKKSSQVPGATVDKFNWGDGQEQTLLLSSEVLLPDGQTQKRTYIATHTYAGSGVFKLSLVEQYRIGGILNINNGNSVQISFYLESDLIINPFSSNLNNSPVLYNPPLDLACFNSIFEHNPTAVDPDGDSLSYQLVECRGEDGASINYVYPDQISPSTTNNIYIDPLTGTVHWESPQQLGIYNIAILITEWRNGVKVGTVLRDMQITVNPCSNKPPVIDLIEDTCILANTNLEIKIRARDTIDTGDVITISASGAPFVGVSFPAILDNNVAGNPATADFKWSATCEEVRLQPYEVVIRAVDDGTKPMADYETFNVRVIAPKVNQVGATMVPNGNLVVWQASQCLNASCYRIYRTSTPTLNNQGPCDTGPLPGEELIGTVDGRTTTNFTDTAVDFGGTYCYRIVTCFPDGSLSQVSDQACSSFRLDLPMLYKASVGKTDAKAGIDTVAWYRPILIDTVNVMRGPYQFKVFREDTIRKATKLVYSGPLFTQFYKADTLILDSNVNTVDSIHTYRVEFYDNGTRVGTSPNGSTIFLYVNPGDRKNTLKWKCKTPWFNTIYSVEVKNLLTNQWDVIGTTQDTNFVHKQLVNGVPRCYRIVSSGLFSVSVFKRPVINVSQEACATPVDLTPPCPPTEFFVTDFCKQGYNEINWSNALVDCNADVKEWVLYYSATPTSPFVKVKSFPPSENHYIYTAEYQSISGCFAFGAVDSNKNEYIPMRNRPFPEPEDKILCFDNCEAYVLPNVFTPNGDGENDLFVPFPYHGVKSVDAKVFNRWGKLLFETTDPAIKWDGKAGGKPVPDGVYFYVVDVTRITLYGEVKDTLKGTVTIFAEKQEQPK